MQMQSIQHVLAEATKVQRLLDNQIMGLMEIKSLVELLPQDEIKNKIYPIVSTMILHLSSQDDKSLTRPEPCISPSEFNEPPISYSGGNAQGGQPPISLSRDTSHIDHGGSTGTRGYDSILASNTEVVNRCYEKETFNFLDQEALSAADPFQRPEYIDKFGNIENFLLKDRETVIKRGSEHLKTLIFSRAMGQKACPEFHPIMKKLADVNVTKPNVCQMVAWPVILSGASLICIAKTGSGKTFAFMLPGLVHCKRMREKLQIPNSYFKATPHMLVLAPTRELVQQLRESSKMFAKLLDLEIACIHGGEGNRSDQQRSLQINPACICGTPGRLKDFMAEGLLDLQYTSLLVLDEADRMLDATFGRDIEKISSYIPKGRQIGFFSATWVSGGPEEKFANSLLHADARMVHVQIGGVNEEYGHVTNIDHIYRIFNDERSKRKFLEKILDPNRRDEVDDTYKTFSKSTLFIFCNTKEGVRNLTQHLERAEIKCRGIEGDMNQAVREDVLAKIQNGTIKVLVGTDVIGRGIDVKDLGAVIQYTFPKRGRDAQDTYTHRAGRTGRAGKEGVCLTLFTRDEQQMTGSIFYELLTKYKKNPGEDLKMM